MIAAVLITSLLIPKCCWLAKLTQWLQRYDAVALFSVWRSAVAVILCNLCVKGAHVVADLYVYRVWVDVH